MYTRAARQGAETCSVDSQQAIQFRQKSIQPRLVNAALGPSRVRNARAVVPLALRGLSKRRRHGRELVLYLAEDLLRQPRLEARRCCGLE